MATPIVGHTFRNDESGAYIRVTVETDPSYVKNQHGVHIESSRGNSCYGRYTRIETAKKIAIQIVNDWRAQQRKTA